jgi:hypothetical protein
VSSIKRPLTWVTASIARMRSRISESLLKPLNKRVILVVVVTVIATELFIVTDIGPFRFSIGTVVFVYAILSLNHLLIIPTAIMVAFSTLLLRVGFDYFIRLPHEYFSFIMAHQFSGVVYFLLLSLILRVGGIREGSAQCYAHFISLPAGGCCYIQFCRSPGKNPGQFNCNTREHYCSYLNVCSTGISCDQPG